MRTHALAATAMAIVLAAGAAHAGRSCEDRPLTAEVMQRGLATAQRTHEALEAGFARNGTQVVVLARAGQDLTKYNLRYSHLGYAYREAGDGTPKWRVVHKLNHCGKADAALYRQGLGEFFLDDLWKQEAAWSVLQPELQQRLLPVLRDDHALARFHQSAYSMLAYPWATKYQQSNQWALETLALAQAQPAVTREQAQAWLRWKGYEPTTLHLGPITRLGGRMTRANLAFDDHPNEKRFADRIETTTVDSVFAWLQKSGLGSAPNVVAQP